MTTAYEIERKWVLGTMPALPPGVEIREIVQAYPPGIRIRRANDLCYITVKGEGEMARAEWEVEIPEWVFDQLIVEADAVLHKTRYAWGYDEEPLFALDEYQGELEGLITIEAEWLAKGEAMKNTQQVVAHRYVLPDWLGTATEVTGDITYQNSTLARDGLPVEKRKPPEYTLPTRYTCDACANSDSSYCSIHCPSRDQHMWTRGDRCTTCGTYFAGDLMG